MLYSVIYCDVGRYGPSRKMIAPLAIAGIAAAAGSVLSNLLGSSAQERVNKANIANQNQLFEKQKDYQNYLNANSALIQRQSLERAGMNVNSNFGPSINTTASVPQQAQQQAFIPNFDSVLSFLQNMPAMKLQEEQAEAQSIQNEREKAKDKAAGQYLLDKDTFNTSLSEDLKSIGVDPSVCGLNSDNVLPNLTVGSKPHYNMGDFEFKQMSASFEHNLKQYDADDARWALEKLVHRAQAKDKEALEALTKLPKAQLDQIAAATKEAIASAKLHDAQTATEGSRKALFDAQKAYQELQTKIANDSNMSQIFDTIMKEGLSFENVGKMLIAAFVQWMKPR